MKNFDATRIDGGCLNCYCCGREIPDGNWFARIRHGGGRVVFCRPWCVEVFLDASKVRDADRVADVGTNGRNFNGGPVAPRFAPTAAGRLAGDG